MIRLFTLGLVALLLAGCANAVDRGLEAYHRGDYQEARRLWGDAAQDGNPYAQYNLGLLWADGVGGPKNEKRAIKWFTYSANGGFVPAMLEVGARLWNAGERDRGLKWMTLAARWNNENARDLLRSMGYALPDPDLYRQAAIQSEIRRLEGQRALAEGARVFGCAMAGGTNCDDDPSSYGSYRSPRSYTMCPDGSYVSGERCNIAPDGTYVGGDPSIAPDGSFVGGKPTLTPDGSFVGSRSGDVAICPDGSYVGGSSCKLAPDGTYVGE